MINNDIKVYDFYNKKEINPNMIGTLTSGCCRMGSGTFLIKFIGGGTPMNENEPKLVGGFGEKKSNGGTQWYQQHRVYDSEEIAMCHPAQIPNGSYNYQVNESENVRIRKLTPKECFRLMDFDDEDFEKASKVNSDSQLYKQAGNSIVVAVLVAIFRGML